MLSQVALSLGLRFILTPLVLLTSRRRVIGPLVNCPATALAAVIVTVGLILLNALIVISACRT